MLDKNKVYGYTPKQMEEFMKNNNVPKDNEEMITLNSNEPLSWEEIISMFPCQFVTLVNVEREFDESPNFTKACVKEYHCERGYAGLSKLEGRCEEWISTYPEYIGEDLLWL